MSGNLILVLVIVGLISAGIIAVKVFTRLSAGKFFFGIPGVIIGLIIGGLLSLPFQNLPGDFGFWVPLTVMAICVFGSSYLFYSRRGSLEKFLKEILKAIPLRSTHQSSNLQGEILLDTSAIIDGRFLEVVRAGFLCGKAVVFRFILNELQQIADSNDAIKRERGRRGLQFLDLLKDEKNIKLEIVGDDIREIQEADEKLVKFAKVRDASILTTDYNLNRVAKIQGIRVLNVNELAEAIKPQVVPGELLSLKVVQVGKERDQGVGYLADGTMIVVEKGEKLIGKEVEVVITRIIQTPAGKMFFSKKREKANVKNSK